MNFEPQCKTKADLYREWARVLDMCEAHNIKDQYSCMKHNGLPETDKGMRSIKALECSPFSYEFAIAIVEGKPVFRGDVLYLDYLNKNVMIIERTEDAHGRKCLVIENGCAYVNKSFSWNPSKPKFQEGDFVYCKVDNQFLKLEGNAVVLSNKDINGLYQVQFDDCKVIIYSDETMLSNRNEKPKTFSIQNFPVPDVQWHTERSAGEISLHLEYKDSKQALAVESKILEVFSQLNI